MVAVSSEKLEADYLAFIKKLEEASSDEINKIRQDLDALKVKAAEIGASVEFSS
jgi:hypothetical protein